MLQDIETLAVRLVQEAPVLDAEVLASLRRALEDVGTPLALTICRIYELVGEGLVAAAISLPALAEACATLVAGELGKVDQKVLDAARYQIDTLTPMPDRPPRIATPDVPLTSLKRKP
ncbi:MAG TPA: hypothetical protein VLB44_01610 [Kofleriaceae bacterium]|nr:hypothetical protein [Kofleriaceae bacterium]